MSQLPQTRPGWHWPLLLLPALLYLGVASCATPLAHWLGISGWLPGLDLLFYCLPGAALLCFGLGFWWAWARPAWFVRGLSYGALLVVVNAAVCWACFALLALLTRF